MNYFLNYENGEVTVDSFRHPDATATTVEDIIETFEGEEDGALTASLDLWCDEQINDLWGRVPNDLSEDEVNDFVFTTNDFVQPLEDMGIDVSDVEFIREMQNDFVEDYLDS